MRLTRLLSRGVRRSKELVRQIIQLTQGSQTIFSGLVSDTARDVIALSIIGGTVGSLMQNLFGETMGFFYQLRDIMFAKNMGGYVFSNNGSFSPINNDISKTYVTVVDRHRKPTKH